ncbi:hypothetical protein H4S00_002673 [Coemansia sp. D1744]|nr:hypothetical protein H4S00_002673 [Coemansia sp. D1744]
MFIPSQLCMRPAKPAITPLPITKSLSSLTICDAPGTEFSPTNCTPSPTNNASSQSAESGKEQAHNVRLHVMPTPTNVLGKRGEEMGLFDDISVGSFELDTSVWSAESSGVESSSGSGSVEEEVIELAWSGIDGSSDNVNSKGELGGMFGGLFGDIESVESSSGLVDKIQTEMLESSSMSMESSSVSKESPSVSKELSSVSKESPSVSKESPSVSKELSSVSMESSSVSKESPSVSKELSSVSMESSSVSLKSTSMSLDSPSVSLKLTPASLESTSASLGLLSASLKSWEQSDASSSAGSSARVSRTETSQSTLIGPKSVLEPTKPSSESSMKQSDTSRSAGSSAWTNHAESSKTAKPRSELSIESSSSMATHESTVSATPQSSRSVISMVVEEASMPFASEAPATALAHPNGVENAECTAGMFRCTGDKRSFDTCVHGRWGTIRTCSQGTTCLAVDGNSIACA